MSAHPGNGQRDPLSVGVSTINNYVAHKQHLLPETRLADVVQVCQDVVALHATGATVPYLSLWARVPSFRHEMLEDALYQQRALARLLAMRVTLHIVSSDQFPTFLRACRATVERRTSARFRGANLLAAAGVCDAGESSALLEKLERQIVELLVQHGPATLAEISQELPELQATLQHDVGKAYEGRFSIGSRLLSEMCARGTLIRARPRGSWRSNLYEYAALGDWLPGAHLAQVKPQPARTWLVRQYLSAFGPALVEDVLWWTGFTKSQLRTALNALEPEIARIAVEGMGDGYLMLAEDAWRLGGFSRPNTPYVFFLPGLDPLIMGYLDRRRYLAGEHEIHVVARAGNTVSTVWVNGRVAGAWGQRTDGSLIYGLFEPVDQAMQALLTREASRLESFLAGEYLPPRYHTPFTRNLEGVSGRREEVG
jgi:uncharacterized protein YcaQ